MREDADRKYLAEVIHRADHRWQHGIGAGGFSPVETAWQQALAQGVLESDWLAEHDRQVLANADQVFPTELPARVGPTVCDALNPCPDRPTFRLGRWIDRPWRCPQCSRWWVTVPRSEYAGEAIQVGYYIWIRAEESR